MNWEKLEQKHFHKKPIEHFYSSNLFDSTLYDKLYENQNNLDHLVWQEFDAKYKTGFQFYDDISQVDKNKEIICLWFFKERSDLTNGDAIELQDKVIKYMPNTFLITKSKDIKIISKKDKYIRRPFVQIDFKIKVWEKLIERFDKRP